MQSNMSWCSLLLCATFSCGTVRAGDGNRLAYLDEPFNPYYVGRNFPKLTTPQWVGEDGVEAVVVLAIDDMRGTEKWEQYLRPIIERLKPIDGRAPVSVMTCTVDPQDPHLQTWLNEGLSLEVHTIDHPCPLLKDGDFARAKSTYDRCIDLLCSVPNNKPVAFRMPCCDSLNTVSPRFFAEIFARTTEKNNFLRIDTSVFNLITPNDPELPRELVFDRDGNDRFRKYLPGDRTFVNTIEDYPYPYVIGRLCWEFPCVVPSDWSAQHRHQPNNPITVEDWKAALDAVVIKQGVFNLVFHPHGWIKAEQIVELIDHAVAKHGPKVKFLTFSEARDRLAKLDKHRWGLRYPADLPPAGEDNGVRLVDVNNDSFIDRVWANGKDPVTHIWSPQSNAWEAVSFPAHDVRHVEFGVTRRDGFGTTLFSFDTQNGQRETRVYHFDGRVWVRDHKMATLPSVNGMQVTTFRERNKDAGVRFRDLDADGMCELIVSNEFASGQQASFRWDGGAGWQRLPFRLPAGTSIVDDRGRDAGLRFVDLDEDGHDDVVFSNADRFSIHLFDSMETGWSREVLSGKRGDRSGARELPPIVRDDGTDNGFFVHSRHLFWQNEDTNTLKDLLDRRSFNELLTDVEPAAKSPEASLKSIQTRPGFQVELVAAEPMVMDPIAFAWGPDGKFWVVEMGDYPLGIVGTGDRKDTHGGRVRFLDDTDGDGRYDRSTVFLDRLGFPTGVMPWRNGVLVTCAPEIFYAEDTDGDGKADNKESLFSGFVPGNPQHRVNGLVWGLDNWVYGANGDSGGMIRSSKTGKEVGISGRDFRFRPDTGAFEPETGQTQFGRSRDDWGNWFGCSNSNPMWHFALPDHYVRRNPHVPAPDPRVNVSVVPGASPVYPVSRTLERFNDPNTANRFTSACSAIVYRDDLFGPAFEGNSFVSEPVHNLIHREIMSPRGVTFTSRRAADEQTTEFVASTDNWFRPTTIQTGPDGALWIADMYRLVIEHPEWIPKEQQERLDLRAGHDKGRIYRVSPVGKPARPMARLDTLDTAGLVAAIDSPSGWQRDMAHMMLLWYGDKSAGPELERLVETCERPAVRLQALCAMDGLDALSDEVMLRALTDKHAAVRWHAVRLSEPRLAASTRLAECVVRMADDPEPRVRMQVAFSLGEWRDERAGHALGRIAVRDANDPYLAAAVVSSAVPHAAEILAALCDTRSAEPAAGSNHRSEIIERLLGQAIGQGNDRLVGRVLEAVTPPPGSGTHQSWQLSVVAGVLDSLERRGSSLPQLHAKSGSDLAPAIARLDDLFVAARHRALDAQAEISDRRAAIRLLGRATDHRDKDLAALAELLTPQTPGELQEASVAAAGRLRDANVPEILLEGWPAHGPKLRSSILDVLISRDPWTAALLDRLNDGRMRLAEIDAVHRQRLVQHRAVELRDQAAKLFGRPSDASRQKVLDQYRDVAKMNGDPERGAVVFQKHCGTCHRLGGAGHDIGPDLSSMAHRSAEVFLTAILDPNRAVETRYVSYLAATRDGRVFTGMLASETGNSVTLVAQEGKRETLLRTDIEAIQSTGKSLMPEDLERDIPPQAMADLLAYVHSSGPPRKVFDGNNPQVVRSEALRGEFYLLATSCEIYGRSLVFEDKYKNLGRWSSEDDHAVWTFEVTRPGRYAVSIDYACDDSTAGNSYELEVGDTRLVGTVAATGSWDTYMQPRVGTLTLEAGQHRLVFRPNGKITGALIDLRGIRIRPEKSTAE